MEKACSGEGLEILMEEIWKLKVCGAMQLKTRVKIILKVFLFININFNASEYSKIFDCIIKTEFSLLKSIHFKKAERQKIIKTHNPKTQR